MMNSSEIRHDLSTKAGLKNALTFQKQRGIFTVQILTVQNHLQIFPSAL